MNLVTFTQPIEARSFNRHRCRKTKEAEAGTRVTRYAELGYSKACNQSNQEVGKAEMMARWWPNMKRFDGTVKAIMIVVAEVDWWEGHVEM